MDVISPGAGELIADAPERGVEVLCETGALHATWWRFGAGREGADLHVHRRHSDLFYVLSGELTVRLGPDGEGVVARAGTLARIPPLVVHGYRNASADEVRFLNFHAPGSGFAAYLRALRDGGPHQFDQEPPPADGGRPAGDAYVGGATASFDEIELAELGGEPSAGQGWLFAVGPGRYLAVRATSPSGSA